MSLDWVNSKCVEAQTLGSGTQGQASRSTIKVTVDAQTLVIWQKNRERCDVFMWGNLLGRLPENLVLFCTVLAFLIPYVIYKINQKLHKYADPPWKKNQGESPAE